MFPLRSMKGLSEEELSAMMLNDEEVEVVEQDQTVWLVKT